MKFAKVMFLHLSVSHSAHRGGDCLVPGGLPGQRVPDPGGVPGLGVSGPRGCLVCGVPGPRGPGQGAWSGGGAWWRPTRTATAAGGTHPTGMHSCYMNFT